MFLTWFATRHPIVAATIVAAFLLVIVVVMRWVIRALKNLFRGAEREIVHPARNSKLNAA